MIKCLDHGFVRLVDHVGNDLSVVRAARVSHDAVWRTGVDEGKDEKLIHYLMKNHHTTPFEMVDFTFEIQAPIFVFRQWHRHRTWSYNEVSARYTELPEVFYVPDLEKIGSQDEKNKQVRNIKDPARQYRVETGFNYALNQSRDLYIDKCKAAFDTYRFLLNRGWPRELARSILPVSTYSHMFAKVDLHNLLHFLGLRLHAHAQYEIRVYADAMYRLVKDIVPISIKAWESYKISYNDIENKDQEITQLRERINLLEQQLAEFKALSH